jgi:hypothetical protein
MWVTRAESLKLPELERAVLELSAMSTHVTWTPVAGDRSEPIRYQGRHPLV